jgi:hypothetical protein
MEILIPIWIIVCCVVGGMIGDRKGRTTEGVILGLLLGPIGCLLIFLSADKNRVKCAFCAESIMKEAKLCPKHS